MEDIEKTIRELRESLSYHSKKYHLEDAPEIDDYEYDMMFKKLLALEAEYPQFDSPASPTRRVGGATLSRFEKASHNIPLLSLQDVFSVEEVKDFCNKVKQAIPTAEFIVEQKIDGLSVALEYTDGFLVKAATRGDGTTGEDVTENIKTIHSVPLKLSKPIKHLVVRGEVYMPKRVFAALNEASEAEGKPLFANPRNAAAGSLRQLDPKLCAKRRLDILVFNLQEATEDLKPLSHSESLRLLSELGFKVNKCSSRFCSADKIVAEIEKIGHERTMLEHDIDGAVVKVDRLEDRRLLGETSSVPRWAVAYKYPPEVAQTLLEDITIAVGRTGVLTPNAVLSPVRLAGTTVSRASLHNIDYIAAKDIRIGDTVLVRKAGDIIPEVVSVVKQARRPDSVPFIMPEKCPSCGEQVTREPGEAATRCTNISCTAQLKRTVDYFVSRDAMNIEGLGSSISAKLIDAGLIKDVSDIYYLSFNDLMGLEGQGEKSAKKLLASIEKSKLNPLSRLICAFGIRHIGEVAASLLSEHFGSLDALASASVEELCSINEIGMASALSIREFFSHNKTKELLEKLSKAGVAPQAERAKSSDILNGKTFVITGTLPTLKRDKAEELIKANGGVISSSVSKKTDFLLCGSDAGSKLAKAQALGIKIIGESEFQELLKS